MQDDSRKTATKVAPQIEELIWAQIGRGHDYFCGISVEPTKDSRHPIPDTYKKDFYLCVMGAEGMEIPKELKLQKYFDGILIHHEQVGRPQFAAKEFLTKLWYFVKRFLNMIRGSK